MQQNKLGFKNLRPGQQYEVTIRTSTAAGLALPGNTSGQFNILKITLLKTTLKSERFLQHCLIRQVD